MKQTMKIRMARLTMVMLLVFGVWTVAEASPITYMFLRRLVLGISTILAYSNRAEINDVAFNISLTETLRCILASNAVIPTLWVNPA